MKVEMKDSGIGLIGRIPSDWKIKRLKDIGYLYGGLVGKSGDDFNVNPEDNFSYYIPFTNIYNNHIIDIQKLSKVKYNESEIQNCVKINDLLFLMSSEDYDGIGKSALCFSEIDNLFLNSFCKGFRILDIDVYSKFLHYYLTTETARDLLRSEAKGFIRINLRQDKLACCPIIVPPFQLQQQIANFLDDKCAYIDQLITLQQQMIDELKAYKQSVITEVVCKGLDKSVPMKDSGIEWIGEVPEGWKIRKVKTLSIMINGYAFDSQKFGLNNKNKVLRIGDIFDGVINREITTNIDDVIELEKYILQENDIVIALSGATVGKIGYVNNLNNEKIYVNQRVGIIRADNHKLLFYFLQSNVFRKYVELLSWGSAQPNISLNQIGEFKIPFSVSDGLSIVSYLDQKCSQIDTLISIKQQKIEELKEYKKSMIYEYITGKKQVEL